MESTILKAGAAQSVFSLIKQILETKHFSVGEGANTSKTLFRDEFLGYTIIIINSKFRKMKEKNLLYGNN